MLRFIIPRDKAAVGLALHMNAVMSQCKRQEISSIGDLLLRADTDPGSGPNFFVLKIGKYF